MHYEVFSEDVTPEIFMSTVPQCGVGVNIPGTDESHPLDNEMFSFRKGVLEVDRRSGISRADEYFAFLRRD